MSFVETAWQHHMDTRLTGKSGYTALCQAAASLKTFHVQYFLQQT